MNGKVTVLRVPVIKDILDRCDNDVSTRVAKQLLCSMYNYSLTGSSPVEVVSNLRFKLRDIGIPEADLAHVTEEEIFKLAPVPLGLKEKIAKSTDLSEDLDVEFFSDSSLKITERNNHDD